MWRVALRTIPPALLLVGGVASGIYGAKYHFQPVTEEQEMEIPVGPPPSELFPGSSPFGGPPGDPAFAGPPGMPPFPPFPGTITETVYVTQDESELTLIREVTFGGVTLHDSGELRRTYTGTPPSLCPT